MIRFTVTGYISKPWKYGWNFDLFLLPCVGVARQTYDDAEGVSAEVDISFAWLLFECHIIATKPCHAPNPHSSSR